MTEELRRAGAGVELGRQAVSVVAVVDRSGSMQGIARDMEGGIKAFLANLEADPELQVSVTLAQFDERYELLWSDRPIAQLPAYQLAPRGRTALWDAVGTTVSGARERLAGRPDRVVVLVVTDGMENASTEWTGSAVTALVEETKAEGWEYVFLAANVDAATEGARFGMRRYESVDYDPTGGDVAEVMAYASEKVARLSKGEAAGSLPSREEWRRGRRRP